jgi:hypothetical protein
MLFVALVACGAAQAQVRIEPATPKAQATVRVQVTGAGGSDFPESPTFNFRQTRVAMVNNRITVPSGLLRSLDQEGLTGAI